VAGVPPAMDLKREAALQGLILKLIRNGLVESAHDCSEGGLAVALAECTFDTSGIGVTVNLPRAVDLGAWSVTATLFGESASRIVVSVAAERIAEVLAEAEAAGISVTEIGETGGDRIRISVDGEVAIDCEVARAETTWATAIEQRMTARD
jgi:phosphoribosylformylglycinamidine synthase